MTPSLTARDARRWIARWDEQQEAFIPLREERFTALLDVVGEVVPARGRVLDLGCGTGSLSARILDRFGSVRCDGVDLDPVLLEIARRGRADPEGRQRWVDADLRHAEWTSRLPARRYDAVVSSTALHWLTARSLGRVYREAARLLRPGGVLLNADFIPESVGPSTLRRTSNRIRKRGRRPRSGRLAWKEWEGFWTDVARVPALAPAMAEHRRRFPHAHGGLPELTVFDHTKLLRRAGFSEVETVWLRFGERVLAALTPR